MKNNIRKDFIDIMNASFNNIFEAIKNVLSSYLNGSGGAIIFFTAFFVVFLIVITNLLLVYFLSSIALYRMANFAGYDKPWLAFIPYAKHYIEIQLPVKEYNFCDIYHTGDRGLVFKWYLGFVLFPVFCTICSFAISTLLGLFMLIPLFGSLVSLGISALFSIINFIYRIVCILFMWNVQNDLLITYKVPLGARIPICLFSNVFFTPIVYSIALLVISGKPPVYGYNNYYNPERFMDLDNDEYGENNAQSYSYNEIPPTSSDQSDIRYFE